MTPRNNHSSIMATLIDVSKRLGTRFHGGRSLSSANPTFMANHPQRAMMMPATRNPAGNCQLLDQDQPIFRSWNRRVPIHWIARKASRTAANKMARAKNREKSVSLRNPNPGIADKGWLHQKSTGAKAAPKIRVPRRKNKIFLPVDKGTSK